MRLELHLFIVALLVHAAVPVAAQTHNADALLAVLSLPACPLSCIVKARANSTCAPTDLRCSCADEHSRILATACIMKKCTIQEGLTTQNTTATACGLPIRNVQNSFRIADFTFISVSIFFMVGRFTYKIVLTPRDIWLDDFFLLMTFAFTLAGTIVSDRLTLEGGMGRDVWTLKSTQVVFFAKYHWISAMLYFADLLCLRLSLLFFFARIFSVGKAIVVIYATMMFNVCFGLSTTLALILTCRPVPFVWERYMDDQATGKCINSTALVWAHAFIGIALDFWMLSIPLYKVYKLQMPLHKKIATIPMFLVGFAATIVGIIRLMTIHRISTATLANPTMTRLPISAWSIAELNVGIVCACMPTFRLILVRLFPCLGQAATTTLPYSGSQWLGSCSHQGSGSGTRHDAHHGQELAIKRQVSVSQRYSWKGETEKTKEVYLEGFDEVIVEADGRRVAKPRVVASVNGIHSDDEVELLELDQRAGFRFGV